MNARRTLVVVWCGALVVGAGCPPPPATQDAGPAVVVDAGPMCKAGQTKCGAACVDVKNSDSDCGSCGHACGAGAACVDGACQSQDCLSADCGPTQVCVDERCVGLDCLTLNCPTAQTCFEGKCWPESCGAMSCVPGFICRNGACTDVACLDVTCTTPGDVCHRGECSNDCVADAPCATNPGAPCKTGKTSCAGGVSSCVDNQNAPAGSNCGADKVCDATGACVTCVADAPCTSNPSSPCRAGKQSCVSGLVTCLDDAPVDGGVSCGANQFCDGMGSCNTCNEGAGCLGNLGAPCITGKTTCVGGVRRCADDVVLDAGVSCGASSVCGADGGCLGCEASVSCTGNPNPCVEGETSCTSGSSVCVDTAVAKMAGESCGANAVCGLDGGCVSCTQGAACSNNPAQCVRGVIECETGAPKCVDGVTGLDAGAPCGVGQQCDGTGSCAAASCADGAKNGTETDKDCGGASCGKCAIGKQCSASSDCLRGICDTGTCRVPVSCKELHTAHPTLGSGAYELDPDKSTGSIAKFTAHCDMVTSGGGWTALLGPSVVGGASVAKWPGLTATATTTGVGTCPAASTSATVKNDGANWVAQGVTSCPGFSYKLSIAWTNPFAATQALFAATAQAQATYSMLIDGTAVAPNVFSGTVPSRCNFWNGNGVSQTPAFGQCWSTVLTNATPKVGAISGNASFELSTSGGSPFTFVQGGSIYKLYVR